MSYNETGETTKRKSQNSKKKKQRNYFQISIKDIYKFRFQSKEKIKIK